MTKQFRHTYDLVFLLLLSLTACTSYDDQDVFRAEGHQKVTVHTSLSMTSQRLSTRAADGNATDAELMNSWTVVVTDADGKVVTAHACIPTGSAREADDAFNLLPGNYKFYSFANISPAKVAELLGVTIQMPALTASNTVYEATAVSGTVTSPETKTVTIQGNNFDPTADNGLGDTGIPMSNVQSASISEDSSIDLVVIRLLAKMEIRLYNDWGFDYVVESVTLSDITQNSANNLLLLPSLSDDGHNTPDYSHGDIRPNVGPNAPTGDLTIAVNKTITADMTVTSGKYETVAFYVNESATPTNAEKRFFLKVKIAGETEARSTYIDDVNATAADNGKWNYIARNDYRVLPVVISSVDKIRFTLVPYDFPAIGVYPASVMETGADYTTITFHDYGHFHLLPRVTDGLNNVIRYGAHGTAGRHWELDGEWADAWKTYASAAFDTPVAGGNPDGFYATSTDVYDSSEGGGVPLLDTVTPWKPSTATTYEPFIFGKIAAPATLPMTEEKVVFHEMKIKIYDGTTLEEDKSCRIKVVLFIE